MTNALDYAKSYLTIWPIATLVASLALVAGTIFGAQIDHLDLVQTASFVPSQLLMAFGLKIMLVGYFHERLFSYPRRLGLVMLMLFLAATAGLLFALPVLHSVAQRGQI